ISGDSMLTHWVEQGCGRARSSCDRRAGRSRRSSRPEWTGLPRTSSSPGSSRADRCQRPSFTRRPEPGRSRAGGATMTRDGGPAPEPALTPIKLPGGGTALTLPTPRHAGPARARLHPRTPAPARRRKPAGRGEGAGDAPPGSRRGHLAGRVARPRPARADRSIARRRAGPPGRPAGAAAVLRGAAGCDRSRGRVRGAGLGRPLRPRPVPAPSAAVTRTHLAAVAGFGLRPEWAPFSVRPVSGLCCRVCRCPGAFGRRMRATGRCATRLQPPPPEPEARPRVLGTRARTAPLHPPSSVPRNRRSLTMSAVLDQVLAANDRYATAFGEKGKLTLPPARRFAVLTCMDARIDPAKALGLSEGDAHVIRNAGGRASDDAIRSLVISHK